MGEVRSSLNRLARVVASKGVPPFVLASNIHDPAYRSVRLWKEDTFIMVETVCDDPDTAEPMTFLYRYDSEKVLLHIDVTHLGRTSTYYDRSEEIRQLAEQVVAERHSGPAAEKLTAAMAK